MAPTFRHGDRLLSYRRSLPPRKGDVVVFGVTPADYPELAEPSAEHPAQAMLALRVKRVVACAGDPVPAWMSERCRGGDGRVPDGHVVVAGDAPRSEGSRELGFIAHERIQAVIVRRLRTRRIDAA